jgi:hypothetical protein
MARKAAPVATVLVCGWCNSIRHDKCAAVKHGLRCDCKEGTCADRSR